MSTIPRPVRLAELSDSLLPEFEAMIPPDAPDLVSPGWIGEWVGISQSSVIYAVRVGKLPALAIPGSKGSIATWAVRPRDAARVWGRRLIRSREAATATATTDS